MHKVAFHLVWVWVYKNSGKTSFSHLGTFFWVIPEIFFAQRNFNKTDKILALGKNIIAHRFLPRLSEFYVVLCGFPQFSHSLLQCRSPQPCSGSHDPAFPAQQRSIVSSFGRPKTATPGPPTLTAVRLPELGGSLVHGRSVACSFVETPGRHSSPAIPPPPEPFPSPEDTWRYPSPDKLSSTPVPTNLSS